jgi:2-polyprenyl-3-methyl-5-hydroxy-6-metoxy-1,4-benzoquinol methylase
VTVRENLPRPVRRALRPLAPALAPVSRLQATRSYRSGLLRRRYPETADELSRSPLARAWWYYSMELLPGVITAGQYPSLPLLPRMLLRRCDVEGASCLDLGSMEGLIPALLAKRGARDVLAVDHANECLGKLDAVRHYHGVDFEYRSVGLMYRLHEQLAPRGFDVVNCSGLLYHVFSPLSVLVSARALVKPGGLMIVSTNVILDPEPVMRFNVAGQMQAESNTYWYLSATLLDYMLRYLRLEPVDCLFLPHSSLAPEMAFDRPSGYLAVACRAVDTADADPWMLESAAKSMEYLGLSDWELATSHERSNVRYDAPGGGRIDLAETIERTEPVQYPAADDDSHLLRLDATS